VYSLMDDIAAAAGWPWMQVIDHLDEQMVGYIERSPFLQLGTADAEGLPFVSPKGDHAVRKRRPFQHEKKIISPRHAQDKHFGEAQTLTAVFAGVRNGCGRAHPGNPRPPRQLDPHGSAECARKP
jgi:hypothetical protein